MGVLRPRCLIAGICERIYRVNFNILVKTAPSLFHVLGCISRLVAVQVPCVNNSSSFFLVQTREKICYNFSVLAGVYGVLPSLWSTLSRS